MAQWERTVATKHNELNLVSKTHIVDGEERVSHAVL